MRVVKPSQLALAPRPSRRLAAARIFASFGRQEVVVSTGWHTLDELELLNQLGDLRVFHRRVDTPHVCDVCEGLA